MRPSAAIAFGSFTLDERERILARDGKRVALSGKPFDILAILLRQPYRVVGKDEFLRTVWPDVTVSDGNLKQNVALLRKALAEAGGDGGWIEAVPRLGYRWIGPQAPSGEDAAGEAPGSSIEAGPDGRAARVELPQRLRGRVWLRRAAVAAVALGSLSLAALVASRAGERLGEATRGARSGARRAEPLEAARIATERGRYLWNRRSGPELQRSLALFSRGVELAPDYAPAHAGLADASLFDLSRRGEAALHARRALALDPSLGQPYATLGFAAMLNDWDWGKARAHLETALQRDPQSASARQWLALWHALRGDHASARVEIERALAAHPVSLSILADAAELAYMAGQDDRAAGLIRDGLELDAGFVNLHVVAMKLAARQRRDEEWLAEGHAVLRLSGASDQRMRAWAAAFEAGGYPAVLREERRRLAEHRGDPYALAELDAALGERDAAVANLERAVESRSFRCVYAGVEPVFAPLRREARFRALLRRLGLPTLDATAAGTPLPRG